MKETPRIAIIGWDSATFDIINPLINAGVLPNLKKLLENGQSGTLLSTLHPISPVAWASFMTGMHPGKHGIFDFLGFNLTNNVQLVNGGSLQAKTLWNYLGKSKY